MAASSYATPRIARSKSGADLLFDRMKQEQFRQDEQAAIDYLNSTLDLSLSLNHQLHQELKDGVLLCNLVNKLKPGTIKQVGQRDLSFIKMDNITRFLQGARQLGLNSAQLFETIDLFEAKDMTAVIHTILAISRLTEKQIAAAQHQHELQKQQLQDQTDQDEDTHSENNEINEFAAGQHSEDRSSSKNTYKNDRNSDQHLNHDEEEEEEEKSTKYRDVRDIFGDFSSSGTGEKAAGGGESRLRLNRDALVASRKAGLRSTYTAPSDTFDHDDDYEYHKMSRTTPSSPTSNSFSRPPKSPLRLPPRYDDHNHDLPPLDPMATHSSISSVNSSVSAMLPKTPKNASIRNKSKDILEDMTNQHHHHHQQQQQKKQNRRLSSPAERTKRQSNTFPNRNNTNGANASGSSKKRAELEMMKEEVTTPVVKGGSLGHKLDRQYRETANEILAKSPTEDDKEERLLLHTKDDQTTTHYQLGNCIGKGQFGSVYRALDLATGEIVAVKRLLFENGELDQEMMKEVALLKTLSHSNVIRYLGFIQSKHSVNIILEFAENGSLMSTLKAFGAFPEKLVASFCIKILNGLEYLHQNQVVHCDLKAANILTTKTGDVKLTDFGVSLNLKIKGADAGSVSGTPNWMAPEVIELKGASTKSDIWSLGCTLVELVTGKPPYADMIAMSAMFRIVEDQCPPLPENISSDMKNFLEACFQKDPESRPSATELKQHPWILQNQQRIKKTETYSHDLSSYLRNHPQQVHPCDTADEDQSQQDEMDQSNMTLRNSSGIDMGESQMTLYDDEDEDTEQQIERLKVPLGLRDEEDYITHRFIHTSFGKVECKVCGDLMTAQSIFCEVCALICHEHCKKSAFSCPPKVNEQQPSYDWVFSAKIYNRSRKSHDPSRTLPSTKGNSIRKSTPVHLKPEDAESIRQYALALGLTPQEEQALNGNQALLSHTLSLQQQHKIDPGTLRHKALATRSLGKDEKKKRHINGRRQSEECIIS
ncbi:protein kinase [Mucor ambiguus]|uniref:Protein kinase n=1 Tax=Mucor ambiguus TaxID=91626 RepID=A0A0C9LTZ1_9FUNG|nr:protein kinase [Mucor ambiguus]